jgi:mannose-6-phosphate isomerase
LPFLLKVLAAAEPLSLQSHPSTEQAKAGYARENRLNIPVGNSRRIYRDPFAKPELICALGPFEALCGFREPVATVELLHSIGGGASIIARLLADHDLDHTMRYLFGGGEEIQVLTKDVIEACQNHESLSAQWVNRLAVSYPDDPAVVASLLLNYVTLEAGEALYLDPGNLHAYLSGTGIEVMGSSDNVVRCGLTNKHVDVNELLATVVAQPLPDPIVRATPVAKTEAGRLWKYATPDAPFTLWVHQIDGTETLRARTRELTLCGVGATNLLHRGEVCYLAPGEELTLSGKATLFRVTEND